MIQEFFFGNYLAYPRCIKVAVGQEIDLDFNNHRPIGPTNNKIWYTTTDNEIYDSDRIIEILISIGGTYNGPAIVSNEYNDEKQMWCMTFDDDVTILGDFNEETMTAEGPCFVTNPKYGLACNVETIILPKTTTRIGDYTFYGCSGLTSVTIPNSVTSIGSGAFYNCRDLTAVTIPNSVISIGDYAFAYCSGLTSVTILDSVTNIGEGTFYGCSSLTSIEIPDNVISIGVSAFAECIGLTSVLIGYNVTSIGDKAFAYCSSLTSVTIPYSVTSIGEGAFDFCTSLSEVIYTGTINEWNEFGFTEETSPFNYLSPVEYVTCSNGQTELVKNDHH